MNYFREGIVISPDQIHSLGIEPRGNRGRSHQPLAGRFDRGNGLGPPQRHRAMIDGAAESDATQGPHAPGKCPTLVPVEFGQLLTKLHQALSGRVTTKPAPIDERDTEFSNTQEVELRFGGFAIKVPGVVPATGFGEDPCQPIDVIADRGVGSDCGRETMAARILSGYGPARVRTRAGALLRVSAVGSGFSLRRHGAIPPPR
jgi:hypothetical protein